MFVYFFIHSDEGSARRQVSSFKSYSYSSSSSHSGSGSRGVGYGAPAVPSSYSSASSHSYAAAPVASSYSGAKAGSYGSNVARNPGTFSSYGSHGGYGGYGGGHAAIPLAPIQRPSPSSRPYSSAGSVSSSESRKYGSLEMQSGSGSRERSSSRKVCTKKPLSVMNAKVKCTLIDNKCVAKCINGYQFPTGETSMDVICEEGEWTLRRSEWNENLSCERE